MKFERRSIIPVSNGSLKRQSLKWVLHLDFTHFIFEKINPRHKMFRDLSVVVENNTYINIFYFIVLVKKSNIKFIYFQNIS